MKLVRVLSILALVSTLPLQADAAGYNPFAVNPAAAYSPYNWSLWNYNRMYDRYSDFFSRYTQYVEAFMQTQPKSPQDTEKMKKLLGYYDRRYSKLTPEEKNKYNAMVRAMSRLTWLEWSMINMKAMEEGKKLFYLTVAPELEKTPPTGDATAPGLPPGVSLPDPLKQTWDDIVKVPSGAVVYSKHLSYARDAGTPAVSNPTPLFIGGGFPFNQAQFAEFNEKISRISDIEAYDPICNGVSVLYDAVMNNGQVCKPYETDDPIQLLTNEIAFRFAHSLVRQYAVFTRLTLSEEEEALFKLTRLSYQGITLADQAHALAALSKQQGYGDGQAFFAGISYGGLLAGKIGALYPGRYKALVLFSPGVENPAHAEAVKDVSVIMEATAVHRKVLEKMVSDIANSPHYDAYRPAVLKDYDPAFRNSLRKKMLGELDMNLAADLERATDRIYMITGAKDAAIKPETQIEAMRAVFKKPTIKGSYILVPKGGHALWGNPKESAEDAVAKILTEIQKGPSDGLLKDGGVYMWNDAKATSDNPFDYLGTGLTGLDAAEQKLKEINAAPAQ